MSVLRRQETLQGLSRQESHATALARRALRKPRVEVGGQLEGEHPLTRRFSGHSEIMGTALMGVNTFHQATRAKSVAMSQSNPNTLGALIRSRRQMARPPISQGLLGDLVGLDQRSISNIENGEVENVRADVANRMVAVLPVTMPELIRAMGYNLPERVNWLPSDLQGILETAEGEERAAILLTLRGAQTTRAERQGLAPKQDPLARKTRVRRPKP